MAQQLEPAIDHYVLSTRVGTECVAHAIQALTDLDPAATVLSIVGAFDLVSRQAILEGLQMLLEEMRAVSLRDAVSLVSIHLSVGGPRWCQINKATHSCRLCSPLRCRLCNPLRDDERMVAFSMTCVVCSPDRVSAIHGILQNALFHHSPIRVHHGKTQVWNKEGLAPCGMDVMQAVARIKDPEAIVCGEVVSLPTVDQGVRLLGTPLGHPDFVRAQSASLSTVHDQLLQQVPTILDLHDVVVLLLLVGRTTHATFAAHHDASLR